MRKLLIGLCLVPSLLFAKQSDHKCLTEALYHEIRGGNQKAMQNVADVIVNRQKSEGFPSTICGVIRQPGQFTYKRTALHKIPKSKLETEPLQLAERVATNTIKRGSVDKKILFFYPKKSRVKLKGYTKLKEDTHHKFYGKH